jgi:hypothetical protein
VVYDKADSGYLPSDYPIAGTDSSTFLFMTE